MSSQQGFEETSSLDSEEDLKVDMGCTTSPDDKVVKLVMKSPEHHYFIMKRPDGTCYKTVNQKNKEPVSYNVHKMYKGWNP